MGKRDYSRYAEMYQSGMSLVEISADCGLNTGTLYRGIKCLGVPMRNLKESWANSKAIGKRRRQAKALPGRRTFDHAEAAALYQEGMSLNQLATRYQVNNESLRQALQRMGVEMRRRGGGDGKANHQYKGGTYQTPQGYVIRLGTREKRLEHRLICEAVLGRPLNREECVHHINGDRKDNRKRNLLICTQGYHMQLHARMRKQREDENRK